jgi:hypothetical protein
MRLVGSAFNHDNCDKERVGIGNHLLADLRQLGLSQFPQIAWLRRLLRRESFQLLAFALLGL